MISIEIKGSTFINLLQGYQKILRYITVNGKIPHMGQNRLKDILTMLHHFKHNKIDRH